MKLNLGCGPVKYSDEIGVDLYPTPAVDVVADITKRLPFEDCSADQVRLDHVLEHLPRYMTLSVILEAHRILKVGGKLIVGLPDMERYFKTWLEAGNDFQLKTELLTGIYGGQHAPGEFHMNGFDPSILKDILETAGFEVGEIVNDEGIWRTEGFCMTTTVVKT